MSIETKLAGYVEEISCTDGPVNEIPTYTEAALIPAPAEKPARLPNGRWLKGVSGNRGGKSKLLEAVRREARKVGPEAIKTLTDLMRNAKAEKVRLMAAMALLDRGFGKPAATIDGDGARAIMGVIILPAEQTND